MYKGMKRHNRDWAQVAAFVDTRTVKQVRAYSQRFCRVLQREGKWFPEPASQSDPRRTGRPRQQAVQDEMARKRARIADRLQNSRSKGSKLCEDCSIKPARWSLKAEHFMRWCKECCKAHTGAGEVVCLRNVLTKKHKRVPTIICEDCQRRQATDGLSTENHPRWCVRMHCVSSGGVAISNSLALSHPVPLQVRGMHAGPPGLRQHRDRRCGAQDILGGAKKGRRHGEAQAQEAKARRQDQRMQGLPRPARGAHVQPRQIGAEWCAAGAHVAPELPGQPGPGGHPKVRHTAFRRPFAAFHRLSPRFCCRRELAATRGRKLCDDCNETTASQKVCLNSGGVTISNSLALSHPVPLQAAGDSADTRARWCGKCAKAHPGAQKVSRPSKEHCSGQRAFGICVHLLEAPNPYTKMMMVKKQQGEVPAHATRSQLRLANHLFGCSTTRSAGSGGSARSAA